MAAGEVFVVQQEEAGVRQDLHRQQPLDARLPGGIGGKQGLHHLELALELLQRTHSAVAQQQRVK